MDHSEGARYLLEHRLVLELEPYIIVTEFNQHALDFSPFGLSIPRANRVDPTRLDNEPFLGLLQQLDGRTFGPEGMPMDRWVFYDCCYMPGAILGFARQSGDMSDHAREVLAVPDDYVGLVPYSMFIAIPMASSPTDWMGHNLASIGPRLPEENLRGLGTITKAFGLKSFGTKGFFGATQWSSNALFIHSKFGPLDLLTAYTPAHSEVETLTYGFECSDYSLLLAVGAPGYSIERPEPDMWVVRGDTEAMIEVQDRIEAGERFVIPGPPRSEDRAVPVTTVKP